MTTSANTLPSEVLARVFSDSSCYCAQHIDYDSSSLALSPISLSSVCRHWRRVAINHQCLWTHIDLSVDVTDHRGRYHSPKIWAERSKGASLYVRVHQPHIDSEEYYAAEEEQSLPPAPGENHRIAPMVTRLLHFLLPLMPQICSLTVSLSWPYQSTLTTLLDQWMRRGPLGGARILKSFAHPELTELKVPSSELRQRFFESLEVLHLHNTILTWGDFSFGNLTELELDLFDRGWPSSPSELAAILESCPKLRYLSLGSLFIRDFSEQLPQPVNMRELRSLRIGEFAWAFKNGAVTLKSVLDIIDPGQNELDLKVVVDNLATPIQPALDALNSFVNRTNVKALHLEGSLYSDYVYFATQLGVLPRVNTLVLEGWYICDYVELKGPCGIEAYENPCPIDSEHVLWPQLQDLYLDSCFLDKETLHQLVSLHPMRAMYLRNCHASDKGGPFQPWSSNSQNFIQILSQEVLKVVHVSNARRSWPQLAA